MGLKEWVPVEAGAGQAPGHTIGDGRASVIPTALIRFRSP